MPFIPATNVAECRIVGLLRGQLCENVLHFFNTLGAFTQADLNTLADNLGAQWNGNVLPLISSDYTFELVQARDLTTQFAPTAEFSGASAAGGGGDAMPNNVASCFSLRTGLPGRSNRGRLYIGGIPRDAVTENNITAGFRNSMLTALGNLIGQDSVATGFIWSVLSRQQNNLPLAAGISRPITVVITTDSVVDSQRRRLPGRGK